MNKKDIYFCDSVKLEIQRFPAEGYVLDIGGGGEGVIGRLEGLLVIAIDCREDELAEAPKGPLKIFMDAKDLKFLDASFGAVTAFFSFMYFDEEADLKAALSEAFRVLKAGGCLHVWDVDIAALPASDKPLFAVPLKYIVNGIVFEAAYGRPWPKQTRDSCYYRTLAEAAGFLHISTDFCGQTFYSTFRKQ